MKHETSPSEPVGRFRMFNTHSDRPLAMLRQCPAYEPTPLRRMPELSDQLGLSTLFVKDETRRMRLGSFKALGGVFAVAQMICDASGASDPTSEPARQCAAGMTFITASAGNHGLSVAAGARIFGARGIIVLCSAVPVGFAERIRRAGSEVVRIDGSYEDSVDYAISAAERNGWLLLADGSWDGYTGRPALVMEGYSVLAEECRRYFEQEDVWPDHVFLQAGVGGLAAAMAAHCVQYWQKRPNIVIVEPDAAPCMQMSVKAGQLKRVEGPVSNMGRLDCKDASLIAFEALRHDADSFVTVTDEEAGTAARLLAQHGIATTPSGAAGLAALNNFQSAKGDNCLLIATEGLEDI